MRINLFIPCLLITPLIFAECKKGEDDPFISLRTRKARVVGIWEMTRGYKIYTSYLGDRNSVTYTPDSYAQTWSNGFTETGPAKYIVDFQSDGEVDMVRLLEPHDEGSLVGTWNFTGGVGKAKNKEQLVLHDDRILYRPDIVFNIRELRNKKLVIRRDINASDGARYEEEFEFKQ